jgi:hypothetical protein
MPTDPRLCLTQFNPILSSTEFNFSGRGWLPSIYDSVALACDDVLRILKKQSRQ